MLTLFSVMKKYGICLSEKEMQIWYFSGTERNIEIELVKCGTDNRFKTREGTIQNYGPDLYKDKCDHKIKVTDLEIELMLFNKNPKIENFENPF